MNTLLIEEELEMVYPREDKVSEERTHTITDSPGPVMRKKHSCDYESLWGAPR